MGKGFLRLVIVVLAVILALLLAVCFRKEPEVTPDTTTGTTTVITTEPTTTTPTTTAVPTTQTEPAPTAPEIHPSVVGIYIPADSGSAARRRITEFSAKRTAKTDIDCFEVLASHEEMVNGSSFKSIWNECWNAHGENSGTKVGFHLAFTLSDGTEISQTIRKPGDAKHFYEYLEVYLYDDIHQTGWYSHLEDGDMTEGTMITSIKLTSGSRIGEVGDIFLTAFLYTGEDCFDEEGNYIGTVQQTVKITE